jgi:hypothetical protein
MIEDRLWNWGNCQRVLEPKGRCRSIEHRYTPERIVGESWESRQAPKLMLDRRDAEIVEKAWKALQDARHKRLLLLHYIHRSSYRYACKDVGIRDSKDNRYYFAALSNAQYAIQQLLQSSIESRRIHENSACVNTATMLFWAQI